MFWLSCLISIFIIIIVCLLLKIHLLRKTADEIREAFADRISSDTNTLIDISSRDSHMMNLAADLNGELKKLQKDRLNYQQGDLELKDVYKRQIQKYLQLLKKTETLKTPVFFCSAESKHLLL